jgi:hypothetical protein
MIPFILGALAAVGLSELSKRNKPKMADGGGVGEGGGVESEFTNQYIMSNGHILGYGGIGWRVVEYNGKKYAIEYINNSKPLVESVKNPKAKAVLFDEVAYNKYSIGGEYPLMASGGGVNDEWVVYNCDSGELISIHKSHRSAKQAQNKIWNKEDIDCIGIEKKSEWDILHN